MNAVVIRKYEPQDFDQLCLVMDSARRQELANENLAEVFVALRDAPYLKYFLSLNIEVAVKNKHLVGFVGYGRHRLEFLYVDSNFQKQGIATALMKSTLAKLKRPVKLSVFSNNEVAKNLYKKFGFKVVDTVVEKWSDEVPQIFSEDTMELE